MLDVILSNDTFKLMDKTLNYVADSISYRFPHHLEETSDDVRIELDNVPTLPISIKTTSILKAENSIIGKNGIYQIIDLFKHISAIDPFLVICRRRCYCKVISFSPVPLCKYTI
jgi:hypothetical protein